FSLTSATWPAQRRRGGGGRGADACRLRPTGSAGAILRAWRQNQNCSQYVSPRLACNSPSVLGASVLQNGDEMAAGPRRGPTPCWGAPKLRAVSSANVMGVSLCTG